MTKDVTWVIHYVWYLCRVVIVDFHHEIIWWLIMAYREACLSREIQILRRKHILELVENKNTMDNTCICCLCQRIICSSLCAKIILKNHWPSQDVEWWTKFHDSSSLCRLIFNCNSYCLSSSSLTPPPTAHTPTGTLRHEFRSPGMLASWLQLKVIFLLSNMWSRSILSLHPYTIRWWTTPSLPVCINGSA